jgi:hypothetical protein
MSGVFQADTIVWDPTQKPPNSVCAFPMLLSQDLGGGHNEKTLLQCHWGSQTAGQEEPGLCVYEQVPPYGLHRVLSQLKVGFETSWLLLTIPKVWKAHWWVEHACAPLKLLQERVHTSDSVHNSVLWVWRGEGNVTVTRGKSLKWWNEQKGGSPVQSNTEEMVTGLKQPPSPTIWEIS